MTRTLPPEALRKARWLRVGAFARARREALGLSQADLSRILGSAQSAISNVEVGREGLPPKRAYAWAEALDLPRDEFFRFVIGEIEQLKVAKPPPQRRSSGTLSPAELELVERYRRLPARLQRLLRARIAELEAIAGR